jgi:predicted nucleic acid-binding protein
MRGGILLDTGPLVAYLWRRDRYHDWAVEMLAAVEPPLITCEPVLTETCFLVARGGLPATQALEPVERGRIEVDFRIGDELAALRALMQRYANVPMSLADACLVRLAELTGLPICTLDSDFAIYRAFNGGAE